MLGTTDYLESGRTFSVFATDPTLQDHPLEDERVQAIYTDSKSMRAQNSRSRIATRPSENEWYSIGSQQWPSGGFTEPHI